MRVNAIVDRNRIKDLNEFAERFRRFRVSGSDFPGEKSLQNFQAFWSGYTERETSGQAFRMFVPSGFHEFVDAKYLNDTTHGAVSVVSLYSRNQVEAWDRYFDLLDTFRSSSRPDDEIKESNGNDKLARFEELVPAMLSRPAMYVGSNSFGLLSSYIEGWLRATRDMEYEASDYEIRFRSLLSYIEEFDINLPGPSWSSIVSYWAGNDEAAIELFSGYIEEYVTQRKGWIQRIEYHMDRRLKARRRA